MTEDHLMVPTSEELKKWEDSWFDEEEHPDVLLIRAYQAGADAELEACCEALDNLNDGFWSDKLRAARRPKPPSLKEQALADLENLTERARKRNFARFNVETIRRALEQLDD